jgi:hypothetical protein
MPKVECPKCGKALSAPANYKGRTVKCKACRYSFLLGSTGSTSTVEIAADKSDLSDNQSTVAFRLNCDPKSDERPPRETPARRQQPKDEDELYSVVVESWRAEIYKRVIAERFSGNRAEFTRVALDALTRQLGYSLAPPDKPTAAE